MEVTIKSFNGIGDLLFVTPTLRVIKEAYPDIRIKVNTNYPVLLRNNPYVDEVGIKDEGVFLGYPDPIHQVCPTEHHIISDWRIVTGHYGLTTARPDLKPAIYTRSARRDFYSVGMGIGVQRLGDCKPNWDSKRVWPYLDDLIKQVAHAGNEIRPIPHFNSVTELVSFICGLRLLVCTQGGLQQIAQAVGTPTIVIYGGFANPEWNGYEEQLNLCNPKTCSYCWHPHPCISENRLECLTEIRLDMVLKSIRFMIEGKTS